MRISDWSSDVCSSDLLADRIVIEPARHRRQRHLDRFAQQPPCLPEDQRGDHEADDGIDPAEPGLPDHEPGDHHHGRYRRVRDHVEVRPADVEVDLAPAREQPRGGAVDDDPEAGYDRYGEPRARGWVADGLNRVEKDSTARATTNTRRVP